MLHKAVSTPEDKPAPLRVLILEDNPADAELNLAALRRAGYAVTHDLADSPEAFSRLIEHATYDVILADYNLRTWTGMDALDLLRQRGKDVPLILVTATLGDELATECLVRGAADYVLKDNLSRLPAAVERVLHQKALRHLRLRTEEALRESEQKYRALVETTNTGYLIVDLQGKVLDANAEYARLSGHCSVEEVLGRSVIEWTAPHDRERNAEEVKKCSQKGFVRGLEIDYVDKNGKITPIEISATVIQTEAGPRILSLCRDITERKQAEMDLEQKARQQAALAQFGQRALAGIDLRLLFNEAVALVAQTLEVEYCKVLELLLDGSALLLRAGVGWKEGLVGNATVSAGSESQAGYTLLSHAPVIAKDLRTETRFQGPPLLREHNVVSGMSVIIPGRQRPFGILGAHTRKQRNFTEDDVHFLQAVAHTLALAIERRDAQVIIEKQLNQLETERAKLRTLSRQLMKIQEEERRRLGRELHDQIGQLLTAVRLNLALMQENQPGVAPREARRVRDTLGLIDQCLEQIRNLSYLLRPPLLEEAGLLSAVRWFLERYTKLTAIRVDSALADSLPRMPQEFETAIFRVLQESLTNVSRHAQTTAVQVELKSIDRQLHLVVADQGRGFDPVEVLHSQQAGVGLIGMQERIRELGGKLDVQTAPGQGTRVCATLPLPEGLG